MLPGLRLEVAAEGLGHFCARRAIGEMRDVFAVFAHQQNAATNVVNSNFALRQSPAGDVQLNAATNQTVSIRQGGISVRLGISAGGHVIVGGDSDLNGAPATGATRPETRQSAIGNRQSAIVKCIP